MELVPFVGPMLTLARALAGGDSNMNAITQSRVYDAYIWLQIGISAYASAYVLTDGFTQPAPPIYAFY